VESEVKHLQHQMKLPRQEGVFSEAMDVWFRKNRFIYWKRFVEFNANNPEVVGKQDENYRRQGSEIALQALNKLNDEDWSSFDKMDEVLEPVYDWYCKNRECYWESFFYNMGGQEKHYRSVLQRLDMKEPTQAELDVIVWKLDGINHTLWGLNGIAPYGEKSVLKGKGSFPHEREQLDLDLRNGWDGKSDRSMWRQRRIDEHLINRFKGAE
jgi:hypothetical protein